MNGVDNIIMLSPNNMDPVFPLEIFLHIAMQTPSAFMLISRLSVDLRDMLRDPVIQDRAKAAFVRIIQTMDAINNRVVFRQLPNGTLHGQLTRSAYGVPYESTRYINGKKHGNSIIWYPSGAVYTVSEYSDSQLHGRHTVYYENGSPMESITYDRGYKHGIKREYLENGTVWRETVYVYNIRKEERTYNGSGKLISARVLRYN